MRYFILIFLTIMWGSTYTFVKEGITDIPYSVFQIYRYFIASFILLFFFKKHIIINKKVWIKGILTVGISAFVAAFFTIIGMEKTTATETSFLVSIPVIIVPVIVYIHKHQKINKQQIVAGVVCLMGIVIFTKIYQLKIDNGVYYLLIASIGYSYQYLSISEYVKKTNEYMSAFIQCFTVLIGFVIVLVMKIVINGINPLEIMVAPKIETSLIILAVSIFATALGWMIEAKVQKNISATTVAIVFATEPVFTLLTEYLLLNQSIKTHQIIGGIVIISATLIASIKRKKE